MLTYCRLKQAKSRACFVFCRRWLVLIKTNENWVTRNYKEDRVQILNTGEWQREDCGKLRKKAKFMWAQTKQKGGCGKKIRLVEMSMFEMEGRKKVSHKLTFFPLLRKEKVNYVYPTSNFQIFSYCFPSILVVFVGLRVKHFCSDFRSFYCTVSSTVKIISMLSHGTMSSQIDFICFFWDCVSFFNIFLT